MECICDNCKKPFRRKPSRVGELNFCSHECYSNFYKGKKRRLNSLIGKKYNMLTVLSEGSGIVYKGDKKCRTWNVRCDCGNIKEISTQNLKSTISCGCILLRPEHGWKYNQDRNKQRKIVKFREYIKGAKKRGIDFLLSKESFYNLLDKSCTYCGSNENNGVDRYNNQEGYTEANSVPCCSTCNILKGRYDGDNFINQILKISEYVNNK